MRLIGQEVDALAEHQLNEFAGERLLTGLALKCRSRPRADVGCNKRAAHHSHKHLSVSMAKNQCSSISGSTVGSSSMVCCLGFLSQMNISSRGPFLGPTFRRFILEPHQGQVAVKLLRYTPF